MFFVIFQAKTRDYIEGEIYNDKIMLIHVPKLA